jgi:hypothetical protein
MIEKTEGTIRNGQSRDTGNIGHTRHKDNKIKMSKTDPTNNRWLNPGTRECNVTRIDKMCSTPLHAKQTQKA